MGRVWQWVHQAALESGVEAWPHLFRHTAATKGYAATKDPMAVKELLESARETLNRIHAQFHNPDGLFGEDKLQAAIIKATGAK